MVVRQGQARETDAARVQAGATDERSAGRSPTTRRQLYRSGQPSSYTLNHLLNYTYHRGQGFSASEAVYSDSPPVNLEFEFLFDGTGVVPKPSDAR